MADMPTFQTGHLILASEWNAHADQIDANTAAIAANTSSINSQGSRITTLESRKKCILRKSAAQVVTTGVDTIVSWDVVDVNTGGMRNGNTIVVPPGNYWLGCQIRFPGSTGGTERVAYIFDYTSGSLTDPANKVLAGLGQSPLNTGAGNLMSFGRAYTFTTTKTLAVVVYQNSGANLDVSSASFGGSTFSVTELP